MKKHKGGCGKYTPLILRANAGDWIEIILHNMIDPDDPVRYNDYPSVPLDFPYKPSNRVSLNPQFLKYHPIYSFGINVGFNDVEQTAAPGETITYLWHADRAYGGCILNSFGDLRNHRHHGLFGAAIIEPTGAKFYDGARPTEQSHGEQAVIVPLGEEAYREFVLFAHNGIRLLDKAGRLIKTTEEGEEEGGHGAPDHEDTGEKGYNYRSERFFNRLRRNPLIYKVFDSRVHGDHATPVFKAFCGERVILRLLMPADKPRNIGFVLHGHTWRAQQDDPLSNTISVQGAISVGGSYNIELDGGASLTPGDYQYRSGSLRWDVESGMWGIFRVLRSGIKRRCESVGRRVLCWCKNCFSKD